MSYIEATEQEALALSQKLANICAAQENICAQLDHLIQLMKMPSESVLEVLEGVLAPMNHDLAQTVSQATSQLEQ
ncbi:hypothetical protein [Achromobacter insuavis]|uniref:hypothetical protein n=1 Tax=Achromobacter insuavis TaxID=1287735 RepID=UPI001F13C43C|nr:hypothetical protein [Achromobacter insuavis]